MNLHLSNKLGESVEVPMSIANELFAMVANVNSIASIAGKPPRCYSIQDPDPSLSVDSEQPAEDAKKGEDENPREGSMPLQLSNLDYCKEALEALAYYAKLPDDQRTTNIPRPLNMPLNHIVKSHELDLVLEAEKKQFLVQLLDIASYLGFEQLVALCAAYTSERIDKIAREATNIMDGAERIREFLQMDNEWTPEEMEHLQREMEFAKQVDPSAY